MKRGYFGIGIYNGKDEKNIGTLWRSAAILGADFIFTVGKRYMVDGRDLITAVENCMNTNSLC